MKIFVTLLLSLFLVGNVSSQETTSFSLTGNISAGAALTTVPGTLTFDNLSENASVEKFVSVKDSLGFSHSIIIYFFHTATNAWQTRMYVDGAEIPSGVVYYPVLVGLINLVFNSDGTLNTNVTPGTSNLSISWSVGSATSSILVDLSSLVQNSAETSLSSSLTGNTLRCDSLASCLNLKVQNAYIECSINQYDCSKSYSELVLLPNTLADLAANKSGCIGKTFRNKRSCNKCYDNAIDKIKRANSGGLFGKFGEQALTDLRKLKASGCSR